MGAQQTASATCMPESAMTSMRPWFSPSQWQISSLPLSDRASETFLSQGVISFWK
jgi:hypothetical protein